MKMSQDELGNVIRNHKEWLSSGGTAGKRMRLYRADLCHANLDGADLLKSNLNRADLTGATLKLANLACAELNESNLTAANLQRANLIATGLNRADLTGADLQGTDLTGADLRFANLRGANLQGANLTNTMLASANLACAETDKTYYQVARIGSSDDVTTYCVEDDNIICGCWNDYRGGTLAEFKERVESVYGEGGIRPHAKYYAQYMAAIKFFKKMAKLAKEDKR